MASDRSQLSRQLVTADFVIPCSERGARLLLLPAVHWCNKRALQAPLAARCRLATRLLAIPLACGEEARAPGTCPPGEGLCLCMCRCRAALSKHPHTEFVCHILCRRVLLLLPPPQVATFYTMFNRSPIGRYHVMVCGTTPCMLCGARRISAAIKQHLGIDYGQTTQVRLAGPLRLQPFAVGSAQAGALRFPSQYAALRQRPVALLCFAAVPADPSSGTQHIRARSPFGGKGSLLTHHCTDTG